MRHILFLAMLATSLIISACGNKPTPCPICYEDEWSREPFPGQPKQHIKALTPEDLKANHGRVPTEFLGVVSSSTPGEGRW